MLYFKILTLASLFWGAFVLPAFSYQVRILQNKTPLSKTPNNAKGIQRINKGVYTFLQSRYDHRGQLWVFVKQSPSLKGWVPMRYVSPALEKNPTLRISDLPGDLVFEHAKTAIRYQNLRDPRLKYKMQKHLLLLDIAQTQQSWEVAKQRLNFLELSQRMKIPVSQAELKRVKSTLAHLEARFKKLTAQWGRQRV